MDEMTRKALEGETETKINTNGLVLESSYNNELERKIYVTNFFCTRCSDMSRCGTWCPLCRVHINDDKKTSVVIITCGCEKAVHTAANNF
jgi:hypothetical protein